MGGEGKAYFFMIPLLPSCQDKNLNSDYNPRQFLTGPPLSGRNPTGGLGRLDRCISSPTRHACLYNVDIRAMILMMLTENGEDLDYADGKW